MDEQCGRQQAALEELGAMSLGVQAEVCCLFTAATVSKEGSRVGSDVLLCTAVSVILPSSKCFIALLWVTLLLIRTTLIRVLSRSLSLTQSFGFSCCRSSCFSASSSGNFNHTPVLDRLHQVRERDRKLAVLVEERTRLRASSRTLASQLTYYSELQLGRIIFISPNRRAKHAGSSCVT